LLTSTNEDTLLDLVSRLLSSPPFVAFSTTAVSAVIAAVAAKLKGVRVDATKIKYSEAIFDILRAAATEFDIVEQEKEEEEEASPKKKNKPKDVGYLDNILFARKRKSLSLKCLLSAVEATSALATVKSLPPQITTKLLGLACVLKKKKRSPVLAQVLFDQLRENAAGSSFSAFAAEEIVTRPISENNTALMQERI
jgi:hypothetical protein